MKVVRIRRARKPRAKKETIDKRGVSDRENNELVARFGNGGVYFPFDQPEGTVVVFFGKKPQGKKESAP